MVESPTPSGDNETAEHPLLTIRWSALAPAPAVVPQSCPESLSDTLQADTRRPTRRGPREHHLSLPHRNLHFVPAWQSIRAFPAAATATCCKSCPALGGGAGGRCLASLTQLAR